MELQQQIRDFVTTNFYVADPKSLEDRASLLDHGIIDSTGVLEVIMFIETAARKSASSAPHEPAPAIHFLMPQVKTIQMLRGSTALPAMV